MKAIKVIAAIALAAALCTSCGLLFGNANNNAAATQTEATATNGAAVGTSLLSIFNQYKTDGKVDLNNINNIINLATILANIGALKGTANPAAFTDGLIASSKNVVNKANAATVVDQLINLSGINLSQITNAANSFAADANATVAQINEKSANVNKAINTLNTIFATVK